MADQKISELTALTEAASADELPIVDDSATETKKITYNNLTGGASKTELGYVSGVTSAIQTQIDSKASSSDLTTHESDTTTHGTSGDIVGTSDSQTLTNKTIDGANNTLTVLAATQLSGATPIANGGTGQTGKTEAFDALSPTTTKGDVISNNGSDNVRVGVGTDDQYLAADSSATGGVSWKDIPASSTPLTTKGDVLTYDTADARLAVGADGQVLTADSGEAKGVKWSTPAGSGDMLKSVYDTDSSGVVDEAESVTGTAKKETAGTINVGQAVYISNYNVSGSFAQVELADASAAGTMPAAGIVTSTITDSTAGTIVSAGMATGLDTSSWNAGDILYVSETTGALTSTKPTGETVYVQEIGVVIRSDATAGMVNVIPNGYFYGTTANKVTVNQVGSPDYDDVQDMIDLVGSAGKMTGGAITDNGDGTVAVASGNGTIRATNSDTAPVVFMRWSANSSLSLTDNSNNYIYVEYNSGTPQIAVATTMPTDHNTNVLLGMVYRVSTTLRIVSAGQTVSNSFSNMFFKNIAINGKLQRSSGVIISETGTRNFALTSGTFYAGLTKVSLSAFDSSGADTFDYYYRDGSGGHTKVASQSAIDNDKYDDGSGTLASLSSGGWAGSDKYGVHWVYEDVEGGVAVEYGVGDYTLQEAQDAQAPSDLPGFMTDAAGLVGKIIIQKGDSSFTSIQSAFDVKFAPSAVTDHNNLANIQGGSADERYHLTDAEHTVVGNTSGTNTGDESSATDSAEGIVELATPAEVYTGTDTGRAVTPEGNKKGTIHTFMVQLLADDTDQTADTSIGGDFRIPGNRAITIKAVGAYVDTAGTGSVTTIDINEAGTSILSTKITIDASEKTSTTAATAPVISDSAIAADAIITFDIDGIASTTAAKGLKVWIEYVYA